MKINQADTFPLFRKVFNLYLVMKFIPKVDVKHAICITLNTQMHSAQNFKHSHQFNLGTKKCQIKLP